MVTFVTGHERGDRPDERIDWGPGSDRRYHRDTNGNEQTRAQHVPAHGGRHGPGHPRGVVHRGSTPQQRVVVSTLREVVKDCRDQGVSSPSVVVVGDVVSCHHRLGDLR